MHLFHPSIVGRHLQTYAGDTCNVYLGFRLIWVCWVSRFDMVGLLQHFADCPEFGGVLGSHVWRQSNLHQCQQTNATVCKCVSPRCRSTVIQGSKSGKHWNIMRHLQRYTKMHHWSTRVSVSKVHARHHPPRDEASHTQKLARICSQPGSHSCPNEVMPGDLLPCRFGNVDGIPNWLGLHPEHLHLHGAKEFGQYGICGC